MKLLLTGSTGHVGKALLPRLLADPETRVLALVRARDPAHLAERRLKLIDKCGLSDWADRLEAVRGDVSVPGLGLSAADRDHVLADVDAVMHSAASVRFDMPDDTAAQQNIHGTEAVLALSRALADAGRLLRYDHVSTCYVAGDRRGLVREAECDEGQGFRNSYEWSKCQAEGKVRAAMADGLPVAIHRPSVVVGDSRSGETESFNVMYWPLKIYARGWWRTFPGKADATADIVPVDWLAEAMVRIWRQPETTGRCYHLAVGEDAPTIGELIARVTEITGGKPLRFVNQGRYRKWVRPLLWPFFQTRRGKMISRGGDAFMPYFEANPVFDTTEARAVLGDLRPPPVMAYLERVVRFAVAQDFGREGARRG